VTLRSAIATPEGKRRYVRQLFATIADRYDFITRFLSYGMDRRWKRRAIALANIGPQDRVLDLACGTGDLLFDAAPRGRHAVGLDVTFRMLQLAQRRMAAAPRAGASPREHTEVTGTTRIGLVTGDMVALPFRSGSFDVVTTGYGLRNVPDLLQSIREISRVLAPGGRLVSLDFNRPRSAIVRRAYLAYLTVVGSALGYVLHRDPDTYRYIPESIRNYPGATAVGALIAEQGLPDARVVPLLGGLMAMHVATKSPTFKSVNP
jgi:demethylmenaquinone methyltransferase/2-methoxy-6-polyprenyl-1,4-benzoquinol methylase